MLCEFAFANNTKMMMSTEFQHKEIHKATSTSPDQNTINQGDHMLVNANKKRNSRYKIRDRP